MTDKDKKIVQTLKNHIEAEDCASCKSFGECNEFILTETVLDLINRQYAEIKKMDKRIKEQKHALFEQQSYTADLQKQLKVAKSEAIKKFASEIKNHKQRMFSSDWSGDYQDDAVRVTVIDNIVKEMCKGDMYLNMRNRIRIDTHQDALDFVNIVSKVNGNVIITDGEGKFRVSGKSFLGVLYTTEFENMWVESDVDIYHLIEKFIIN